MSYFIISGPGRCGTYWLTTTLAQFDTVSVWHDIFFPENFEASVEKFKNSATPITGTVSGPTRYVIKELNDQFQPKWGFLLRNPFETIRSHTDMMCQIEQTRKIPTVEPLLRRVKRVAYTLFADLEMSLFLFKLHNIKYQPFMLEQIIEPQGFQKILNWLDIKENNFVLKERKNEMPSYDRRTLVADWPKDVIDYIEDVWNCCPHLQQAYKTCGFDNLEIFKPK